MKKIIFTIIFVLIPFMVHAKCVNTASYSLKGYFEDANNNPVTGKTLSQVLFDVFYDDGTSSTGNAATAEMGQGWYRYSYTANAKNGIWIMRDSTSSYKNFPGGILEQLCDSQVASFDSSGNHAIDATQNIGLNLNDITQATGATILNNIIIPTVTSVTNGVTLQDDAITALKIVAGAIGNDEFNVTERYWPVYNVIDQTNESGDQNPATTSFDTDFVSALNIAAAIEPIIYFPTLNEEPTQDAACNVMEIATKITAYNTTTKVVTVDALPQAPDYRCKFWRY